MTKANVLSYYISTIAKEMIENVSSKHPNCDYLSELSKSVCLLKPYIDLENFYINVQESSTNQINVKIDLYFRSFRDVVVLQVLFNSKKVQKNFSIRLVNLALLVTEPPMFDIEGIIFCPNKANVLYVDNFILTDEEKLAFMTIKDIAPFGNYSANQPILIVK